MPKERIYNKFHEGMKLRSIFFNDEEDSCFTVLPEKEGGVADMKIIMENGQMSHVPWVLVTPHEGPTTKWNLAHLAGVELVEEEDVVIN